MDLRWSMAVMALEDPISRQEKEKRWRETRRGEKVICHLGFSLLFGLYYASFLLNTSCISLIISSTTSSSF